MEPLPLENIRVIDFTHDLAGPFCTMLLGDFGADVIKIEKPRSGDESRLMYMLSNSEFLAVNRNKRSLTLNLKTKESKEIISKLLEKSDVLVENFRPGTMDRLGLGYEQLKISYPKLIYCSITGFGQSGPYRSRGAWDPVVQAMIGIQSTTGEVGQRPVRIGASIFDASTGLYAALGVMAALKSRERTGTGEWIDVAMVDCGFTFMTYWIPYLDVTGNLPPKMGSGWPAAAPYEIFRTKDRDIFIAASTERLWQELCKALGLDHLVTDPRFVKNDQRLKNRQELHQIIESTLLQLESSSIIEKLGPSGIPCAPINNVREAINDPQILYRNMVLDVKSENGRRARIAGIPLKFSRLAPKMRAEPPSLGEDTLQILSGLGYDDAIINNFKSAGVV